jgi:transcriptional regulator with XRE-family HTH domain
MTMQPLREYRKTHGLTLKAMAARLDMSDSQLSRLEREGTTSLPTALRIANATGLPVESFAPVERSQ